MDIGYFIAFSLLGSLGMAIAIFAYFGAKDAKKLRKKALCYFLALIGAMIAVGCVVAIITPIVAPIIEDMAHIVRQIIEN